MNNLDLYYDNIKYAIGKNNLDKLKNSSVMITGANGMIASCIIDVIYCLNEFFDYNTTIVGSFYKKDLVLDRFKNYKNFIVTEQDVNYPISYNSHVDYVINCASLADPVSYNKNPVGVMMTNINGCKNILDYGVNFKVLNTVFVSSGEIYGQGDVDSFDEDYCGTRDSLNYRSCYPVSKIAGETLCACYSKMYDIKSVVVRPSHTYGPTQTDADSRVSSHLIRCGVNGIDLVMKSDGSQVRSYTYVVDCAIGILTALINGSNTNAYNISNNNSIISIRDFAFKVAEVSNREVVFENASDVEIKSYTPITRGVLNGSKLESIGWVPCFSINDGITNTIKIMKK